MAQGRHAEAGSITRVSAQEIENIVAGKLQQQRETQPHQPAPEDSIGNDRGDPAAEGQECAHGFDAIERVVVTKLSLQVNFRADAKLSIPSLTISWSPKPHRRCRTIIAPDGDHPHRPIRAETRARLLLGIAKARRWLDDLVTGRAADTEVIAKREGCSERTVRQNLNLAFLSPSIVKAALDGTLPNGAGITQFIDAGMCWEKQHSRTG